MCVMSMVMDWKKDEWQDKYPLIFPSTPPIQYPSVYPLPTKEEIDEFRRLLERAREYDRKNNEPDCELDEKKKILKDMAERLGVDISFV